MNSFIDELNSPLDKSFTTKIVKTMPDDKYRAKMNELRTYLTKIGILHSKAHKITKKTR